jgi:hypothetical protein
MGTGDNLWREPVVLVMGNGLIHGASSIDNLLTRNQRDIPYPVAYWTALFGAFPLSAKMRCRVLQSLAEFMASSVINQIGIGLPSGDFNRSFINGHRFRTNRPISKRNDFCGFLKSRSNRGVQVRVRSSRSYSSIIPAISALQRWQVER